MVVAGINLLLYTWIVFKLGDKHLPFSEKFGLAKPNAGFLQMLKYMMIMGLFVLVHYLISLLPYGTYVYIAIALVVMIIRKRRK